MWLSPSVLLFSSCIMISIIIIMSSPSLLMSWVALELNTLSFIPLMLTTKTSTTSEASIKYFLTQTVASVIFIVACLSQNLEIKNIFYSLLVVSLSIKLGAAPFHAWMPSVAKSLNWINFFILMTIQKINPLLIMTQMSKFNFLLMSVVIMSLLVGAIQGLNQTSTPLLLTFSSINHMGWMLSSSLISVKLTFFYFILYSILLAPVVSMMNKWNITHVNQMSMISTPMLAQMFYFLSLLSLGGLPPFLGFLPKWIILQELTSSMSYFIVVLMIMMSLLTLFFYLRLTFNAFIFNKSSWYDSSAFHPSLMVSMLVSISLLGLPFTFMII